MRIFSPSTSPGEECWRRNLSMRASAGSAGLTFWAQNAGLQHSGLVTDFDASRWDALFAVGMAHATSSAPNTPFPIYASPVRARSSTRRRSRASAAARA